MKAIILAAGFSTRLYPLTLKFPKGLLEVNHKAICGYVLDEIVKLPQITEIALVTNHLYFPHFAKWINTNYANYNIKLIDNEVETAETRLGAIGDLQFALDNLQWDDDVLVVASDSLVSIDFGKLLEFFNTKQGFVAVACDVKDKEIIRKKLGEVIIDKNCLISEFVEKPDEPRTTLAAVPYYIYPRNSLFLIKQYLDAGNPKDAPGYIVPWLMKKIPVYGYKVEGYYIDVGTKDVLERLQREFPKEI